MLHIHTVISSPGNSSNQHGLSVAAFMAPRQGCFAHYPLEDRENRGTDRTPTRLVGQITNETLQQAKGVVFVQPDGACFQWACDVVPRRAPCWTCHRSHHMKFLLTKSLRISDKVYELICLLLGICTTSDRDERDANASAGAVRTAFSAFKTCHGSFEYFADLITQLVLHIKCRFWFC